MEIVQDQERGDQLVVDQLVDQTIVERAGLVRDLEQTPQAAAIELHQLGHEIFGAVGDARVADRADLVEQRRQAFADLAWVAAKSRRR
ncbi:MAG: hypothetical protein WKF78_06730 [Candidatus Limnocylindrales bacterium]